LITARREGRPKSGEKAVPAGHVPHFKAGKELRERVDAKRQEHAEQAAGG
jgi:integration host factor subunit beta